MTTEPATDPTATAILRTVGITVRDLDRAVDFYTRVIGMQQLRVIELPYLREVIVGYAAQGFERGSRVVLMQWLDQQDRAPRENAVKLVLQVTDTAAFTERIRAGGGGVTREPAKSSVSNATIAMCTDPDGYTLEILQEG